MRWLFTNAFSVGLIVFIVARVALSPFVGDRVCADGWRSYSIGSQGACSWHGGVGGYDRGGWVFPLSLVLGVAGGFWRSSRINRSNGNARVLTMKDFRSAPIEPTLPQPSSEADRQEALRKRDQESFEKARATYFGKSPQEKDIPPK